MGLEYVECCPENVYSTSHPFALPPLLPPSSLRYASIDPCPFQHRLDAQDPQHQVVTEARWGEKINLGVERKRGIDIIRGSLAEPLRDATNLGVAGRPQGW